MAIINSSMITNKTACKILLSILYLAFLLWQFIDAFLALVFVIFVETISITDIILSKTIPHLEFLSYIKVRLRWNLCPTKSKVAAKLSNRVKFTSYINWKLREEVHEEERSNWQLAGITDTERGINIFQFFFVY